MKREVYYELPMRVEMPLKKDSVVTMGETVELLFLKKDNAIVNIESIRVDVDEQLIYVGFYVDRDTYEGSQIGDIYRDFSDGCISDVYVDGEKSEEWIWG